MSDSHCAEPCAACTCAPPSLTPEALDVSHVDECVRKLGRSSHALIPLLQAIQEHYQYLPEPALKRLCEITDIRPAQMSGVSAFYNQFRRKPMGKRLIRVCIGTACHVKGAEHVYDALRRELKLAGDEDTDAAREYTLQKAACLGCCTLAPVVAIGEITHGHVSPDAVPEILRADRELRLRAPAQTRPAREAGETNGTHAEVRVGLGSCCIAKGSAQIQSAVAEALAASGAHARIKRVGCVGVCHQTPMLEIDIPGQPAALYTRVSYEDAAAIIARHFTPGGIWSRACRWGESLLDRMLTGENAPARVQQPCSPRDPDLTAFLSPQHHLATEYCGTLDPLDLDEYVRRGGCQALLRALKEQTPAQIISEIQASGLRGRGGAGFPTGVKWARVQAESGQPKYVICNGDEGDPGAFMDRMLLESYPYRILEGMAIAARAVGAHEGVLYIRAEYPLAVKRIREALDRAARAGWLGEDIAGTGFSLKLRIFEGAGAFVCGEETALLESIEGRRGMPRPRPPFPAARGLFGQPTLINNAETFALVPWIMAHGASRFAAFGTEHSKGTKVFALAGKAARGGLIEVPMGMPIRRIVEEIGGGVASGRTFKAVQIGGPSGGCVPAALADTPVDFEALASAGAIMGSGGLIVLDDTDCMVDMARYFLQFTQNESCGRCTFCRIGTRRMLDLLENLCAGKGKARDLEELETLAHSVQNGSLCGLGRTAPNPVLSTLKHYRREYEAHVSGRCPAGRCKALIKHVVTDACIGCTRCAQRCPVHAIPLTPYAKHTIDLAICTRCGTCRRVCPEEAIRVE